MNWKLVSLTALVIFALALCLSVTSTPATPNTPAAPALTAAQPAPAPAAVPEEHPEIRDALRSMRAAKDHLEHAAHDFGGHRVEAIRATDEAIRQLEICMKFDR